MNRLLSAVDYAFLSGWDFFTYFRGNQSNFIAVGQLVYRSLCLPRQPPPTPDECLPDLFTALIGSKVLSGYATAKGVQKDPFWWPIIADTVARFLLDQVWQDIIA
jgi:hypothetical protein